MIWRADLLPQYLKYKNEIDKAIEDTLLSGRYVLSSNVSSFEEKFANYNNAKYCVGVANGTDAIILSLKALGIGLGDEVITSPFTAYATISAITSCGATPVFVDVCEDSFLIDLDKLHKAIGPKTKAVIPVHLFGNVVNIPKLKEIVGEEIYIVEDACQAHGSSLNNQNAGSFGDIGCFSFYPTKNLGGYGDGGGLITNNGKIVSKIKLTRSYGMKDKDHVVLSGMNSRLDEIQAAVLSTKLKYLNSMNDRRNKIAKRYINGLNKAFFKHQYIADNILSNYHVFQSRFLGDRDKLINFLAKNHIQSNIYYLFPHHLQQSLISLGYKVGDFPVAENLSRNVIALPIYPELSLVDIDNIINLINQFCDQNT